jgi:hypothetical protein
LEFHPREPADLAAAGLSETLVDSLVCKYLMLNHSASGRQLASSVGLPFSTVEKRLAALKHRRFIASTNVSTIGDFTYQLAEEGQQQTVRWMEACRYAGAAPVLLDQYIESVKAQSIRRQWVDRMDVDQKFQTISVQSDLMARIGPAIRSGSGLFLYGSPGNGKTTLAEHIGGCFDQHVWIPKALLAGGNIVQLYDPAHHQPAAASGRSSVLREETFDERWIRVRRPTVVAGGELTLDSLEIKHDRATNISEAPLQLKANCGVLVIDDFGRQRVPPADLLNRWIVPLDRRYDLLSLVTGQKIQVPFELLIIFSTNLEPTDLVDEAFLRRIPYKIHVPDPDDQEFCRIFHSVARAMGFASDDELVVELIERHYRRTGRPMRRCHPRDLLRQVVAYCEYHGLSKELRIEHLHEVAKDYFLHGPMTTVAAS